MTGCNCNCGWMVAVAVLMPGLAMAQGTPGQIAKFGVDGTTVVDSVASEDAAGNVGIGTSTPQARLEVNGAIAGTQFNIGATRILSAPSNNTFAGVRAGSSTTSNLNSFGGRE